MPGIGIIANPHSKLNKRNPKRQELLGYILGEKGQLKITNTLSELSDVAREFRQRQIEILAINGGDGTISRTLTAFFNEYGSEQLPAVALLRGGTMNAVATNLGIRGSPEDVLYRLVEAFSAQRELKVQRITTLSINGLLGFIYADGTAAAFLKKFYSNKSDALGASWLIGKIVLDGIFNPDRYAQIVGQYDVVLDGLTSGHAAHKSCSVMVSAVPKMPMGAKLFPDAWRNPSSFQILSFKDPPRELIWKLPLYVVKRWKDSNLFRSFDTRLIIKHPEGPASYTLDGELFEVDGSVTIDQGPCIDFLRL